jgi:hypothetical protein
MLQWKVLGFLTAKAKSFQESLFTHEVNVNHCYLMVSSVPLFSYFQCRNDFGHSHLKLISKRLSGSYSVSLSSLFEAVGLKIFRVSY